MKCVLLVAAAVASAAAAPDGCVSCHRAETAHFAASGMTRALMPAAQSEVLRENPELSAQIGPYSYRVSRQTLSVSDGKETVRVPIEWAFGQGSVGQTFLFRRDGQWHESRVSYYATLKKLDITMGAQNFTPRNLAEAAGRAIDPVEAARCFDCHATGVIKSPALNLASMRAGIQCERCHGSAESHVSNLNPMRKLGTASTEDMSEFCGQCHRTWSQVASNGPRGIQNVRFQPYRLAISKCYDAADARIRCTTCHDSHRELEASAAAYDAKCTACHSGTQRVCKVASKDCVTCHMPRLELPGAHRAFTDHKIRVVKPGEAYPD